MYLNIVGILNTSLKSDNTISYTNIFPYTTYNSEIISNNRVEFQFQFGWRYSMQARSLKHNLRRTFTGVFLTL